MSGRRFGMLVVLSECETRANLGYIRYLCKCDCGKFKTAVGAELRKGNVASCNCLRSSNRRTHGHASNWNKKKATRTYSCWRSMIRRCEDKNHIEYSRYGGRGITVCAEWRQSFSNFLADMGEKPPRVSIERIDNDAGYCKENCRWATAKEQARNRRDNVFVVYNGRKVCLAEASELSGIPVVTLSGRIARKSANLFSKTDLRRRTDVVTQ